MGVCRNDSKGKHRAAYSVTSRGTKLFLRPLSTPGGAGGTMGAGFLSQFVFMAITAANHTTGLRPWKCTPSVAYGDVSPRESVSHDSQSPTAPYESCSLATPEGEILAALYLELLMNSNAERRENFPLRGKWCAAPKGVHFQRAAGAVVWFAIGRSPVVKAFIQTGARRVPPQPFEPFEPGPRSGPSGCHHNPRPEGPSNLRTL